MGVIYDQMCQFAAMYLLNKNITNYFYYNFKDYIVALHTAT